jgi:hypothetical protein
MTKYPMTNECRMPNDASEDGSAAAKTRELRRFGREEVGAGEGGQTRPAAGCSAPACPFVIRHSGFVIPSSSGISSFVIHYIQLNQLL